MHARALCALFLCVDSSRIHFGKDSPAHHKVFLIFDACNFLKVKEC